MAAWGGSQLTLGIDVGRGSDAASHGVRKARDDFPGMISLHYGTLWHSGD